MIKGYVDHIGPGHVEGWAHDSTRPDAHLEVELIVREQTLVTGVADLFREDLAAGRIGRGDHAFRLALDEMLDGDEQASVVVRVRLADGQATELPHWTLMSTAHLAPAQLTVPIAPSDYGQRPVFIIGAARSGTSAVVQSLKRATPYRGNQEGLLIEMIGRLDEAIAEHYTEKAEDLLDSRRDTMIKMTSSQYFTDGVAALFVAATRQLFPEGLWVEKTPGWTMIELAPRLAQIWPNARFIFMRRRPLENLASRRRKYPELSFAVSSERWGKCMRAWVNARAALTGRALELDQLCLARAPETAAAEIGALISLDDSTTAKLAAKLAEHRPEQTSMDLSATLDASAMGWSPAEWEVFNHHCGEWMRRFNYSLDCDYFASERPDNWFVRV